MTVSDAQQRLAKLMPGFRSTQCIFAAAELGIPDLIAGGTTTLDGLAEATETNRRALFRLLRYLVSHDVFAEAEGTYQLTPIGELLRSDVEGSRRATARMNGRFLPAWGEISHSLATGNSAFAKAYGLGAFDYFSQNPADGAIFDAVMSEIHGPESAAISAAYDFSSFSTLIDVGGGNGSFLMHILNSNPSLRGTVFDLPSVVDRTRAAIAKAGMGDRCTVAGGNFFKSVPEGADAIMLRHILHDWDDDVSGSIVTNWRRALPADGRVLVAELIMADDQEPSLAEEVDIAMLVLVGGIERTVAEYHDLFGRAGLSLTTIIPTDSPVCLIEGRIQT